MTLSDELFNKIILTICAFLIAVFATWIIIITVDQNDANISTIVTCSFDNEASERSWVEPSPYLNGYCHAIPDLNSHVIGQIFPGDQEVTVEGRVKHEFHMVTKVIK